MVWSTTLAAIGLALTHLVAGNLRFLERIPRSRWLSAAGGVSVAYVFLHLFPELNEGQSAFREDTLSAIGFLEHHVYVVALLSFVGFYCLERFVKRKGSAKNNTTSPEHSPGVFWSHMASFAFYNALIGYLVVHRDSETIQSLIFFFLALAVHFIVNDAGLRAHHRDIYDQKGRWILAAAILLGWVTGVLVEVSPRMVAILFAFVAGGVVLNVMKEELPEERKSSGTAFLIGALSYAALLLLI